jgi:restriction endonuclease Mrr
MFRFIRTQGNVGEFIVRDFHAHIKEVKAGKGICMSVGRYSDEARRFTQARLIDLVEKEQLLTLLAELNNSSVSGPVAAM